VAHPDVKSDAQPVVLTPEGMFVRRKKIVPLHWNEPDVGGAVH
jgi:hypothetical protein